METYKLILPHAVATDFAQRAACAKLGFSDVVAVGLMVACTINDQRLRVLTSDAKRTQFADDTLRDALRWTRLQLPDLIASNQAGVYTVVLVPFVASALRGTTERLALDLTAWVTHELPNFSEFLTWMETTGEDARAFLLATSQSIVTYDTRPIHPRGLHTAMSTPRNESW